MPDWFRITNEVAATAAQAAGIQFELLLDVSVVMNRTGILPGDEAFNLCTRIARSPHLRFGGLHAYDGHLHQPDRPERRQAWLAATASLWAFRERLLAACLPVPRVVAGGTPTLPFFAELSGVECSAGTPVLWDSGQPRHNPELNFLNADVLRTRVISKPSANRLTLDLGHKAVASEMPHPCVKLFGFDDASFVTHIDHICQIAGIAKHVGIGSDLDGGYGIEQTPLDLDCIADLASLGELLAARGYAPADIAGICHGNFVGFLPRVWN